MHWGVPTEMEIGCTSWVNLINQLVNGSSWATARELIHRKNNKENQVCGSEPGPGSTDQGWPLRWRKHCPHCYTEHRIFWGLWGWHEQTCEALRSGNPARAPTQLHRFHRSASREAWWVTSTHRRHFQRPRTSRRDSIRKAEVLHQPAESTLNPSHGFIWNLAEAQGMLRSPKQKDWSIGARNAQSRRGGTMWKIVEPHKVLNKVNREHCDNGEKGAMDSTSVTRSEKTCRQCLKGWRRNDTWSEGISDGATVCPQSTRLDRAWKQLERAPCRQSLGGPWTGYW